MCFAPLKRICHWGPLIALAIVKIISLSTLHCALMWWPMDKSFGGALNIAVFLMWNGLLLYCFLSAMYIGPGRVPSNWKVDKSYWEKHWTQESGLPQSIEDVNFNELLQYCETCKAFKAPRAHHCRKCGHCVLKMDHHCPWINNCVGHYNHAYFVWFLFGCIGGCVQASVILVCSLYSAYNRVWYMYYGDGTEPIVNLSFLGVIICVFALELAIGTAIALVVLLYYQLKGIFRNQTGIEDWIVEKAIHRRQKKTTYVYPYNLGPKLNIEQVLNFSCEPLGDGISWPTVKRCHQFSLTIEQLEQKLEKRQRSVTCVIIANYSGSWLPVTHGIWVCLRPPCTDEARIPLQRGDKVTVTRWKKYWLYGEKHSADNKTRGWFPRPIAMEPVCNKEKKNN